MLSYIVIFDYISRLTSASSRISIADLYEKFLTIRRQGGHLSTRSFCLALGFVITSNTAYSANIYRCTDSRGTVTFTQQGCPSDQQLEQQRVNNQTPGSVAHKPVVHKPNRQARSLTVVGLPQDRCGSALSAAEKRKAIVQNRILAGMTQADVESALGKPNSVTLNNNQQTYRYQNGKKQSRTVKFDQSGCVIGKKPKQ